MRKHRSLSALGTVAILFALAALIAGCGSGDDAASPGDTVASTDSVLTADFKRCPLTSDAEISAGGWAGSVAGEISCDRAGSLIQRHFVRDLLPTGPTGSEAEPIRESDPARYTSAGYDCATFPLSDGTGWHALCATPEAQVSFYITP
jgi:hypothetical protein